MAAPSITEGPPSELIRDREGMTIARNFSILAASEVEAEAVLWTAKGIRRGVAYKNHLGQVPDSRVKCQRIRVGARRPAPVGGSGLYDAAAEYGISDYNIAEPQVGGAPAYNWDASLTQAQADVALDEDDFAPVVPIVNSAGEPFDPPISVLVPTLRLSVEKYVDSFSLSTQKTYTGAINSEDWAVGDGSGTLLAGEALMLRIQRQQVEEDLIRVLFEIEIRPVVQLSNAKFITSDSPATISSDISAFHAAVIDRGRRENISGAYRDILDSEGKNVTEPALLDGAGAKATIASPSAAPTAAHLRVFRLYREADFNALGI